MGTCDVAIRLATNIIDPYYTYKNISCTTNCISSYTLTPVDTKTFTVTVTSNVSVGTPSIGYINLR